MSTCQMPAATITLVRTDIKALAITPNIYATSSTTGTTYGVSDCQYTYNVRTTSIASGVYRVDISFNGTFVGSGAFTLKYVRTFFGEPASAVTQDVIAVTEAGWRSAKKPGAGQSIVQ